ncbi:MAG: hypothetical protein KIT45_07025 [Fimbriimonadia bacterium]|nr:hypothetical protein [Fimbriimonadia bacterium]
MILICNRVQYLIELETAPLPHWAERHAQGCARCQAVLKGNVLYQSALQAAKQETAPVSQLEWSQVRARLQERQQIKRSQPVFHRWVFAMPVAATLIVGAFIGRLALTGDLNSGSSAPISVNAPEIETVPSPEIARTTPHLNSPTETTDAVNTTSAPSERNLAVNRANPIPDLKETDVPSPSVTLKKETAAVTMDSSNTRGNLRSDMPVEPLNTELHEVMVARLSLEEQTNYGTELAYHLEDSDTNALPLPSIQTRTDSAYYLEVRFTEESNDVHSF